MYVVAKAKVIDVLHIVGAHDMYLYASVVSNHRYFFRDVFEPKTHTLKYWEDLAKKTASKSYDILMLLGDTEIVDSYIVPNIQVDCIWTMRKRPYGDYRLRGAAPARALAGAAPHMWTPEQRPQSDLQHNAVSSCFLDATYSQPSPSNIRFQRRAEGVIMLREPFSKT